MLKNSKRKIVIFATVFFLFIVFISIIFVLLKFNIQKNKFDSCLVLKKVDISSNSIFSLKGTPSFINNKYKNYNWRIIISKIKIDAPILEGTSKEVLRKGVGHFKDTGTLEGNICLAAHNRGYKYNFFQEIKKLETGDEIIYILNDKILKFQVVNNTTIKETDMSVIKDTKDVRLTLITCEENKRECRRCIQAEQIL